MANTVNLEVDQGITYSYSFEAQHANGASFNVATYDLYAAFKKDFQTKTSNEIEANAVNSNVTLTIASNTTYLLTPGDYVYDVMAVDGSNNVFKLLHGMLHIVPSATVVWNLESESSNTDNELSNNDFIY